MWIKESPCAHKQPVCLCNKDALLEPVPNRRIPDSVLLFRPVQVFNSPEHFRIKRAVKEDASNSHDLTSAGMAQVNNCRRWYQCCFSDDIEDVNDTASFRTRKDKSFCPQMNADEHG